MNKRDEQKCIERELVLDIDLNDYNDVRKRICECKESNVCTICWILITAGVQVLDHLIRDDFGYNDLLWVFSGRRGVHCWIRDPGARVLSDEARSAFASYLSIRSKDGDTVDVSVPLAPSLETAFKILEPLFVKYFVIKRDLFASAENVTDLLSIGNTRLSMKELGTKSEDRWNKFVNQVKTASCKSDKTSWLMKYVYQIVFQFMYPRLDVNVSTHMNHMLKAPFCVHPKTERICVPFDPHATNGIHDLWKVPTLDSVIREYETLSKTPSLDRFISLMTPVAACKNEQTLDIEMLLEHRK